MKTVIRIESNENGWGIFRNPEEVATTNPSMVIPSIVANHSEFPTPCRDVNQDKKAANIYLDMELDNKTWFCAYKSVEQMLKWLSHSELRGILEMGFTIYKITVTEYQEGEFQTIFTKESIVTKEVISDIF